MTADYVQAIKEHRFDCLWIGDTMIGLVETVPAGDELMIVNVAVGLSPWISSRFE